MNQKYTRTFNGRIARAYRNMSYRTSGKYCNHPELYKGKFLLSRKSFYEWAKNNLSFKRMFNRWKREGFPLLLTPTIDRIDSNKGYHLSNMQWLTFKANCAKSAKVRKQRKAV